jgi:VWFA-related protein
MFGAAPTRKLVSLVVLAAMLTANSFVTASRIDEMQVPRDAGKTQGQAEQDPPSDPGDDVLRISTDLTVLDVQVLRQRDNSVIASLRASDFELLEDGQRQEIAHFSVDRIPLSVILLLDVSGSVRPYIQDIGKGGLEALRRLKPDDEVAVMTFGHVANGYVHLVQDYSRDREQTAERLGRIVEFGESGGGTNIPFALNAATQRMRSTGHSRSRRVIIVVTDNQPAALGRLRDSDMDLLLSNLYESDSLVCALLAGSMMSGLEYQAIRAGRNAAVLASKDFKVDPYVEATGGESFRYQEQVTPKLAELLDRLRTRYSIGYASTNQKYDGRFRKVTLRLTKDAERANEKVVVKTRRGYYAKTKPGNGR